MGDSWTGATPLRNSDFKALLTTPRTGQAAQQQQQKEGSSFKHPRPKAVADPDRDKKFKKPHPKRPGKPGQAGDKPKEGEDLGQYRCTQTSSPDSLNGLMSNSHGVQPLQMHLNHILDTRDGACSSNGTHSATCNCVWCSADLQGHQVATVAKRRLMHRARASPTSFHIP
jgi:hypothetical protein